MGDAAPREIPVLWLQLATCTGCSVSVLNSVSPSVRNVLVDEVIPGHHLSVVYHATIMAGAGEQATGALEAARQAGAGRYVLVVEGSVPTADGGRFGTLGERHGDEVAMSARLAETAEGALAVVALGTCAAFGGIPSGAPNRTGCLGVAEFLAGQGVDRPVVNVPGCPPHPDWFVGTVASLILGGLPAAEDLDEWRRPRAYYGKLVHDNCPRRAWFDAGKFATRPGGEGCLYYVGCKGPVTYADCPTRLWNGGVNWCVGAGAPCIGCVEAGFPDRLSPMYERLAEPTGLSPLAARSGGG